MKLYLDMCALKRPFDDQSQERIAKETHAISAILERIERGIDRMVWSTMLNVENEADPDAEARADVARLGDGASHFQTMTTAVEDRVLSLTAQGLRASDAAHLAFAEAARCDRLITCDDRFRRRAMNIDCLIRVVSPIEYWDEAQNGRGID